MRRRTESARRGVTASGAMAYGGRMHPQLRSDSGDSARVGR